MSQDNDQSLGRIRWACRRGMLELDLLLLPFVEQAYQKLPKETQKTFQRLLDLSDQELFSMFIKFEKYGDEEIDQLVTQIREFARSMEKDNDTRH